MSKIELKNSFDIRYVKLHFTIEFIEDTKAPVYKASALRGGMGEMLLRANCVRDRDCDNCDFEPECIVRRTMYSKMEIQPSFMSSGDSVGYVIECEDYHEYFAAGDKMNFNLILFGKTIVYFSQFLNAFYALGMNGLGKELSRFRIISVTNSKNSPILDGSDVNMKNYEIQNVGDYIRYRRGTLNDNSPRTIRFKSPLAQKFMGEELLEFRADALLDAVCRRIFMLDCFEGIESDIHELEFIKSLPQLKVINSKQYPVSIRRFSTRKNSGMYLKGIEGEMQVKEIPEELLDILIAGELIHIGKNTSFGFGRYHIS